ncbi:Retrovirus-related Pol polyprotein from transposon [Nosema granulosis]|uniref:Retrovirus-related Pol polyprotein from transposon n=1 Tax=Nosema granulosis TaxID=83296 RepID=A0A9P6GYR3_9MICR|nr:Retrovirus-related Pol polyprotein from transposon [Nosema granulosis]
MDPKRVDAIKNMPLPNTKKKLQSFLGLVNYCARFIKDLHRDSSYLYSRMNKKGEEAHKWWDRCEADQDYVHHFMEIKKKLQEEVRLAIPNQRDRFILTTDASNTGVGAILTQVQRGEEKVISFFSALHNKAESNYSTTEKELLGVIKAIRQFRGYLLLNEFTLRTDHYAIKYLFTSRNMKARLARWSMDLQEFKFTIEHIKGIANGSDYLSREFKCANTWADTPKLVSPERGRQMVIFYHDLLGHGAEHSVRYHILKKYKWKGMGKDIESIVSSCKTCQRASPLVKQKDCSPLVALEKNDLWEVDMIGPLPESEYGYKYILTMIDHCTKWAEVVPLREKSMGSVSKEIEAQIIRKHGVPREILTDNGKEFDNGYSKALCEKYGFIWKHGSPYNPTTTGLVERFNRTLMEKLKKITEFGKFDWEICLRKARMAYLIAPHRALGCSPWELEHGTFITHMDKQEGIAEGNGREWFEDIF